MKTAISVQHLEQQSLSNIVFMGMGEPLANYKRVITAVRRICAPAPEGLGISQRSVTVSTVGLVPAIRKLTEEGLQVRLAVSLHTPDDEPRDRRRLRPTRRRRLTTKARRRIRQMCADVCRCATIGVW